MSFFYFLIGKAGLNAVLCCRPLVFFGPARGTRSRCRRPGIAVRGLRGHTRQRRKRRSARDTRDMFEVMARPARRPGNLPAETTSFIGRRRELADVRRKLAETRLVS